jgi:type II secretory pathway component PulM
MNREEISQQINRYLRSRSPRELTMAAIASLVAIAVGSYSFVVEPTAAAFERQQTQFRELEKTAEVAPAMLARYAKLSARRQEIEQFYENADIQLDPLTHLERLLREVAKVAPGAYQVQPRDGVQLAGKYAHKIFAVKFETSSLSDLTEFLEALTSGEQRMLVSQINLEKRATNDALTVHLEVSGFEVVSK